MLFIDKEELNRLLVEHRIHNCQIIKGNYKSIGVYSIETDEQFEVEIAKKYERYNAITKMLGSGSTIEYTIEGKEIKLIRYSCVTKNVIIPNFITAITAKAFFNSGIESITFGKELKAIGANAFYDNEISKVEIPEAVQFIGYNAFAMNRSLVTFDGNYKKNITLLGENTLILDRHSNERYR